MPSRRLPTQMERLARLEQALSDLTTLVAAGGVEAYLTRQVGRHGGNGVRLLAAIREIESEADLRERGAGDE